MGSRKGKGACVLNKAAKSDKFFFLAKKNPFALRVTLENLKCQSSALRLAAARAAVALSVSGAVTGTVVEPAGSGSGSGEDLDNDAPAGPGIAGTDSEAAGSRQADGH